LRSAARKTSSLAVRRDRYCIVRRGQRHKPTRRPFAQPELLQGLHRFFTL